MDALTEPKPKRNTAFKVKIGDVLASNPLMENERLKHVEFEGKQIVRVNIIANIVEKYVQNDEKKYGSITLDDASGQIRAKFFGEDIEKLNSLNQGDTILLVGLLRVWNNEIYITPELIKKREPSFLLLRKLELEADKPKLPNKDEILALKDKLMKMIKEGEKDGGVDIEKIILELKEHPDVINSEIKKLLEEGLIYEPRPGRIRYLG